MHHDMRLDDDPDDPAETPAQREVVAMPWTDAQMRAWVNGLHCGMTELLPWWPRYPAYWDDLSDADKARLMTTRVIIQRIVLYERKENGELCLRK